MLHDLLFDAAAVIHAGPTVSHTVNFPGLACLPLGSNHPCISARPSGISLVVGGIILKAKHAAQRKSRIELQPEARRRGPSALGWTHPHTSMPLRKTRSQPLAIGDIERYLESYK